MKARIALVLGGCIVLLAAWTSAGCSSSELGSLVETGARLSGRSAEESRQLGGVARTFGEAVLPVSQEQELEIGGGVAVTAFHQVGPYFDDPYINEYVTLVGKAVAMQSPRPDLPYAFGVLASETPNAFAAPGGYIFITVGTLRQMRNEAQLAGVLAHEVGHVCARHAIKTLQRGRFLQGMAAGASYADPKHSADYGKAVNAVDEVLFTRGFDKRFEYEADLLGTEYAAMAGYNPWGLRNFLYNLYELGKRGGQGGWFQTHPGAGDRIRRLDEELTANYEDFRRLPLVPERFEQVVTRRLPPAAPATR